MSDYVNPADFNSFLDALDDPDYANNTSFMDLLEPIGFDVDHVAPDGGLGPAPEPDANPQMGAILNETNLGVATELPPKEVGSHSAPAAQSDALHAKAWPLPSSHACRECGADFEYRHELMYHIHKTLHMQFRCQIAGCKESFILRHEHSAHERTHIENHGRVETDHPLACVECQVEFRTKSKLQQHANEAQHSPFACVCGKKFARLDVLNRHLDSFGDGMPKYPCSFCKKHRGKDGFRRRDHLLQHIRGYHKFEAEGKIGDILPSRRGRHQVPPVCPHRECSFYRDDSFKMTVEEQSKNKPFDTQSEYTKHMKMVHGFTPFPCTVIGCGRTGNKGYTREKDLVNHRRKKHPEAGEYMPKIRDVRISCLHPGCDAKLGPNSMPMHLYYQHSVAF
ncbi:CROL alpha [Colletotrichum musicola]|uniref:CROL alpha n=1 Tax=Colletotrichum musicola TaxID=2175873 RepID=A0A8H6KXM6_9PEZI|nr:CROL alpha [Colletotrichum musicola]